MKHLKRWLALMVAAALALSLLTGCCTGGISSNLLLEVLMGQVENVSVETDPAFDRALKAAVQRGGSDPDAVLNALVEELEITAPLRFSISGLGSGSAGQQGLDVVFQSGTNPNAAANNAATAWLPILRGLEGNGGAYSARASLVEVNGGYILAIGVKVEQPGDGGDEPEPVTLKSIAVSTNPTKTVYWVNETFDPAGMIITATYSDNSTKTITGITETDKKDVSWDTEKFTNAGNKTVTISYGGKTATVTVNVQNPTVQSIQVTQQPSQTAYDVGQSFNPIGMKLTVTYNDGQTKTIDSNYSSQGVTWTPETIEANTNQVTIQYGGQTATVNITVNPATVTGIEVTWPDKTYYEEGILNKSDITVTANYSYGSNQTVSSEKYQLTIQGPNNNTTTVADSYTFTTVGSYTLTVTYQNETQTKTITVEDKGYTVDGNTYKASTAHGLEAVAERVNSGETGINITLDNNIDLTGEWTPIGTESQPYTGTFDGNGKTITGLTVNQEGTNYVGLIGYLGSGGKVQNVTLTDVSVTGYWYVGGVVGANDKGTVTACTASGSISGSSRVGGVVGYNGGTMTGCTVSGSVSGDSSVGGVVGWNGGTVTACYATGDVSGYSDVGGVAGRNYYGTVTGCTSSGSVSGSLNVGGVVGYNYGIVTACYWSGYDGTGIGTGSGEATKVDGATITWANAVNAMNTAIETWNTANPDKTCDWRYELKDGNSLPALKKQ